MNGQGNPSDAYSEARELIQALCDQNLAPASRARLETLMLQSREVRQLYLEMMRLHAALQQRAGLAASPLRLEDAEPADDTGMSDLVIMAAISDEPDQISPMRLQDPMETEEPVSHAAEPMMRAADPVIRDAETAIPSEESARSHRHSFRLPSARTFAKLAAAAAVIAASAVGVRQMTVRARQMAMVTASSEAIVEGNPVATGYANVPSGKDLHLTNGCLELKFKGGADVIVQAPATFRVDSPVAMSLSNGRIRATAAGLAHGFVVSTPGSRVTDLGTQFGISVDSQKTEVDVFEGSVEVAPADAANSMPGAANPTVLVAGQAANVASGSVQISPNGATPQAFVTSLAPTGPLDLVDLVCGGDGSTHFRSGAIDQRTGHSGNLKPMSGYGIESAEYHSVPKLPIIDGCFVPSGNMKVDSSGHMFDFGATSHRTFYQIRAGGTFDWPTDKDVFSSILGGVDFASAGHGFLLMHPNAGITIDLAALRQLHPGKKFYDLQMIAGNTYHGEQPKTVPARLTVLIDGASRFDRRGILPETGPIKIDVPLNESDQFLTIVTTTATTDAADLQPRHAWIIIGDPRLE